MPDRDAPEPASLLRCQGCGAVVPCDQGQLLAFAQAGWPYCCGRPTLLYVPSPAEPPGKVRAARPPATYGRPPT
jgi:hypothetical protein